MDPAHQGSDYDPRRCRIAHHSVIGSHCWALGTGPFARASGCPECGERRDHFWGCPGSRAGGRPCVTPSGLTRP